MPTIQQGFVLSAEGRQTIINTFLEIERAITVNDPRNQFAFGRLNGYKEALTMWLGPDIVRELHEEAYALHTAEFKDGKYVAS